MKAEIQAAQERELKSSMEIMKYQQKLETVKTSLRLGDQENGTDFYRLSKKVCEKVSNQTVI